MMEPVIYVLASRRNGSLYIGVTSNIRRRLTEHRLGRVAHTRKYRIGRLVYLERHATILSAIAREKKLKKWRRVWKIVLIEKVNPDWDDLTKQAGWFD
jgi:putative endonuclease